MAERGFSSDRILAIESQGMLLLFYILYIVYFFRVCWFLGIRDVPIIYFIYFYICRARIARWNRLVWTEYTCSWRWEVAYCNCSIHLCGIGIMHYFNAYFIYPVAVVVVVLLFKHTTLLLLCLPLLLVGQRLPNVWAMYSQLPPICGSCRCRAHFMCKYPDPAGAACVLLTL